MLLVVKSKVSEERLKAFITSNLLSFLAGEVSDKYFIDFLKILVTKDYVKSIPQFAALLPKFQKLLSKVQSKTYNRETIVQLIDEIIIDVVNKKS